MTNTESLLRTSQYDGGMENTETRNERIATLGHQAFLDALDITPELNTVATVEEALPLWEVAKLRLSLPQTYIDALEKVLQIESKIKAGKKSVAGFPGVVATAAMGRILDPTYMPTADFYACAPRAIFDANLIFRPGAIQRPNREKRSAERYQEYP